MYSILGIACIGLNIWTSAVRSCASSCHWFLFCSCIPFCSGTHYVVQLHRVHSLAVVFLCAWSHPSSTPLLRIRGSQQVCVLHTMTTNMSHLLAHHSKDRTTCFQRSAPPRIHSHRHGHDRQADIHQERRGLGTRTVRRVRRP